MVEYLGALLHERHHWLQLVGSPAGFFLTFLNEAQASLFGQLLEKRALKAQDLPLLDSQYSSDPEIQMWLRLEVIRRLFFGSRVADFETARSVAGIAIKSVDRLLADLESEIFLGLPVAEEFARLRKVTTVDRQGKNVRLPRQGHWLVGTRHVMECGARVNESLKIGIDFSRLGEPPFDAAHMFKGVYGVCNDLYYGEVGEPSLAKEVALAVLCDLSLWTLVPPSVSLTLAGGDIPSSSGATFMLLALAMADFDFEKHEFSFESVDEIEAYRASVETFLLNRDEAAFLKPALDARANALAPLRELDFPPVMFKLPNEDAMPTPIRGGSRFQYYLACAAISHEIRSSQPLMFSLPFGLYFHDRPKFRQLFDRLPPPLLDLGQQGIAPTHEVRGWLEFHLSFAISHLLASSAMYDSSTLVASKLQGMARSVGGREHGSAILRLMLRSLPTPDLRDSLLSLVSLEPSS